MDVGKGHLFCAVFEVMCGWTVCCGRENYMRKDEREMRTGGGVVLVSGE